MEAITLRNPFSCHVLTIFLTILCISNLHTTLASKAYKTYIKTACNTTLYPQECYESLSPYSSKIKENSYLLCDTALSVTLKAVRNASSTVSKISKENGLTRIEAATIKDCIGNIKSSIDMLQQSVDAMNNLNNVDREFQIDSIKTWVSAALTDENTCMDGFDGVVVTTDVRNTIRNNILKIAHLTSNALALINNLK